jgi:hypothetical protein
VRASSERVVHMRTQQTLRSGKGGHTHSWLHLLVWRALLIWRVLAVAWWVVVPQEDQYDHYMAKLLSHNAHPRSMAWLGGMAYVRMRATHLAVLVAGACLHRRGKAVVQLTVGHCGGRAQRMVSRV